MYKEDNFQTTVPADKYTIQSAGSVSYTCLPNEWQKLVNSLQINSANSSVNEKFEPFGNSASIFDSIINYGIGILFVLLLICIIYRFYSTKKFDY